MRIISGKYKGKRFIAPKKLPVRPTTDFAKEALFNILNNHFYFDEITVLDLFSGIGSISLEFASRGSESVTSVDINAGCIQFLYKTAKDLVLPIETIKSDVFKFLSKHKGTYDIIFADPPYDMDQDRFEKLVDLVLNNDLLNDSGFLIVEHSKHTKLDHIPSNSLTKRYGGSVFSFFETDAEL